MALTTEKSREKQRVTSVLEWKRPDDELPQDGYFNLVIVVDEEYGEMYEFAYREAGMWYANNYGPYSNSYSDDEIVAWAKLPELPKEFGGE